MADKKTSDRFNNYRLIILDIILVITFFACIFITTTMLVTTQDRQYRESIDDSVNKMVHYLNVSKTEGWDEILSEYRIRYNLNIILKDKNGNICYSFYTDDVLEENQLNYEIILEDSEYTLYVTADKTKAKTYSNTMIVAIDVLVGTLFLIIILIVNSFMQHFRSQIIRLATIDEVTGLSNRKNFLGRYDALVSKGAARHAVLFMIDIDKFKTINDTKGHVVGDVALAMVGNLLQELDGNECIIGRWGGDEFIGIYTSDGSRKSYCAIYDTLRKLICDTAKETLLDGLNITLSMGSCIIGENTNITYNMERADKALYVSKENGRNQLNIYEDIYSEDCENEKKNSNEGDFRQLEKEDKTINIDESDLLKYKSHSRKTNNNDKVYTSKGQEILDALVFGVNHMLPFAIGGGILIAVSFLVDGASVDINTLDVKEISSFGSITALAESFKNIGDATFALLLPIIAAFIASYLGGYEAFMAGFMGGYVSANSTAGFLGAFLAGLIAGYGVKMMKNLVKEISPAVRAYATIIVYPVVSLILMNILMSYIIEPASSQINHAFFALLEEVETRGHTQLGAVIGAMMGVDMGGPFNKAAYNFAINSLENQSYDIMAATMVGGMVPPCGVALATFLFKSKFDRTERRRGGVTLLMGLSFITEGVLPYLISDFLKVVPACALGAAFAGFLSEVFGCKLMATHGGIFVFFIVEKAPLYFVSLLAGSLLTALILGILKPAKNEQEVDEDEE